MNVIIKSTLLMLISLGLLACSGPIVKVGLESNSQLNPDRKGDPLPVVVRVYQLNDKGEFNSATFNQIWKNDEAILSKTLLTRSELVINPSSKEQVELDRHSDAKYVGIVAIFRNPIERKWRGMKELSQDWVTKKLDLSASLQVSLVGNTLRITDN